MNKSIVTALAAIGLAQFIKVPIQRAKRGEWDWKTAFESGGMPSSHSAGVTSLATYIALKRGVPTIDFALSTVFGLIVMYDAQGIRRQTGEITLKVNELDEEVEKLQGEHNPVMHQIKEERLKEMLGHQPEEVLGGALFGMIIGATGYSLSKNKN
ncbi:divergent PAP2 family protein [Bacillus marinisedimentorum]|uniref:divergent PAP2 family protein n=1 Tax=Bacillus marinisedimentorum TaxID=1821260 RepID=UPI0008730386|nr:divergent PAP2 family protein [Bacillus marinisedimentorum]